MIFMAHANLAKNAKTRFYEYVSHRSHESHEGCIAEGSQLANSPSVYRGSTAEPGGSYKRSA